jgi:hypothetical protein
MQDDRRKELRARRSAKAHEREHSRLRVKYGEEILRKINAILGTHLSLDTPVSSEHPPISPTLHVKIEESSGLVAAYIGQMRSRHILSCCQAIVGSEIAVQFWFDEKEYMGLFSYTHFHLPAMVDLAMTLEDRVFAAPTNGSGVFVVDYYAQAWTRKDTDFSVIVQGKDLEARLQSCFLLQPDRSTRL